MATITLKGNEIHTNGELPALGAQAADFKLVDAELGDRTLADYAGKKKLLNIVFDDSDNLDLADQGHGKAQICTSYTAGIFVREIS